MAIGHDYTARRSKSETYQDIHEIEKSLIEIKGDLKNLTEASKANAHALSELTKPKDRTFTILGMIISVAFPIGFIIFAAGQYPNKADFTTLEMQVEQSRDRLRAEISSLEKEAIRMRGIVESLSKDVAVVQNRLDSFTRSDSNRRTAPSRAR